MLFTAATIAALATASVHAAPALELSIGGAASVTDVDNFQVTTTLTNVGDETLKLFNEPHGALSSFPESTFTILDASGNSQPFVGAEAKYSFATATKFTVLAPGESVETVHDLASAYNFTTVGDFEISANNRFFYQDEAGNAVAIFASVPSYHNARLSGTTVSTTRINRSRNHHIAKRATFASCSSSRQTLINSAISVAKNTYVVNALSYLKTATTSSVRYKTWFGTYTASRASTVTSHYTKIQSSDIATYTYDCSCTEDYYAYVYPNEFGYVYLCNSFWSASTSGTDSKAGTIIHEASHFTANGGTDDHVYGQSAAKSLALSSPTNAIDNADNHEYFAENTPALS